MIDRDKLHRIAVLFEDEDYLVVSKPAGMAVHGGAGEVGATLIDLIRAAYAEPIDVQLAHRLDRGTSGLLLLAKNKPALARAIEGWDRAEKTYWAIAFGSYRGPDRIARPLVDEDGVRRQAETRVAVLALLPGLEPAATLLELGLESGRTHQIRRHLAEVGHPIALDDRHGDFAANKTFLRHLKGRGVRTPRKGDLLLHARRFRAKALAIEVSAPLPDTWRSILDAGAPDRPVADQ